MLPWSGRDQGGEVFDRLVGSDAGGVGRPMLVQGHQQANRRRRTENDQRPDVFRHPEPGMHARTALRAKPHREWFKRHFEEMRLRLIADGYTIVPNVTESNSQWTHSEMAFDAKRRLGMPGQFGCLHAYWLDDDPDW